MTALLQGGIAHKVPVRGGCRNPARLGGLWGVAARMAAKDQTTGASPAPKAGREDWFAHMARLGEDLGDFLPLGDQHWALFVDASPTLIVSFETVTEAMARPGQLPLAHGIAMARGWSHLSILAEGETWWRDPAVWHYFDRLIDDAFFEDFDRVLFTGSGIGGYAACAYSVAAPGATVLAFAARATMDPEQSGWDDRHPDARRLDFNSRYGYAPDMAEAAGQVFLVLDPYQKYDLAHAAQFHLPWVRRLPMRCAGADPAALLAGMDALRPLIESACEGTLTPESFARLWRNRRESPAYLRQLLARTDAAGQKLRADTICHNVASRMDLPYFRRRVTQGARPDPSPGPGVALTPTMP